MTAKSKRSCRTHVTDTVFEVNSNLYPVTIVLIAESESNCQRIGCSNLADYTVSPTKAEALLHYDPPKKVERHLYRVTGDIFVAYACIYVIAESPEDAIRRSREIGAEWAAKTPEERALASDRYDSCMPPRRDGDVIGPFLAVTDGTPDNPDYHREPVATIVEDDFAWDEPA